MGGHTKRAVAGRTGSTTRVGVRELKTHAARILRDVRDSHTPVVLTHRGRAIGMIVPIDSESDADTSGASSAWDAFVEAGRRLSPRFKAGKSGVRVLAEMRR